MQNTGVDESIPGNAAIQSTMELLDRDLILPSNTRPEISADKRSSFFFLLLTRYIFLLAPVGVARRLVRRDPLDNNYSMQTSRRLKFPSYTKQKYKNIKMR